MWFVFYFLFGIIFYRGTPNWPFSEFFNTLGYKRSASASRTMSALPPAPEIRALNFRSWVYTGRTPTSPGRPLLTQSSLPRPTR